MEQRGYVKREKLGTGTFGIVFRCADKDGSVCCIKTVKINATTKNYGANDHVENEIYLLRNLKHPRIIKFLDAFYADNCVHIVMEYAANGPLSKFLSQKLRQKQYMDESEVLNHFNDLLLGIEYLHMKNVVHKDIKPDNILIADNGRLKLADFGVSKVMNVENCDFKNRLMTWNRELGGTPLYMAPETLLNNQFSFASDIWALGCILHELCVLESPFWFVQSREQLVYYTSTAMYEPIPTKYNIRLVQLVSSMIMPNPEQRATIRGVITNDLILVRYYHSLFDYGYAANHTNS